VSRSLAIALLAASCFAFACTTTSETEPAPAPEPVVVAPPPKPAPPPPPPVAEPVRAPVELPKTASLLPVVGLVGLASLGLGGVIRITRKRANRS
jgi:LPXTG-motif cell wall-anchored protein